MAARFLSGPPLKVDALHREAKGVEVENGSRDGAFLRLQGRGYELPPSRGNGASVRIRRYI